MDLSAFGPEANTRQMVLDERVAFAARSADLRRIHTWLLSLLRPEDINEVDADGRTALNLCAKDYELGRDEGKWWPGGTLQISRVRVCATCRRSLDKLNYSRTQWNKKRVGVSRCKVCVQVWSDTDMDAIARTLATLNT